MNTMDPVLLQRLIDGELDFEQTKRFLRDAEKSPEQWRLIASSFIENQIWESEFAVDESSDKAYTAKKHIAVNSSSGIDSARWLALAAMVLLSASVGFLFSQRFVSIGSPGSSTLQSPGVVDNTVFPGELNQGGASAHQLVTNDLPSGDLGAEPALFQVQLQDANGTSIVDSQVPLYRGRQAEAEEWLRRIKQSELTRRQGFGADIPMQRNIRYLKGQLDDGRGFVIPLRVDRYSPGQ